MMLNNHPLVSVIVLAYNSSKFIVETLESIKGLLYPNVQLIISDDGSLDDTVDVCNLWLETNRERFAGTQLITVEKNTGIPANCNRGILASSGEWIKLIAGDDILRNDILDVYFSKIEADPKIEVLHSDVQKFKDDFEAQNYIDSNKIETLKFNQTDISSKEQYQILLRFNPVYAPTVMIKAELYRKYGLFNEKYTMWEDRPMWLNLTSKGIKFYYIDEKTVFYRIHSNSISGKKVLLFSNFDITKENYLSDYYPYLPFFERMLKTYELNRKKILFKNNMAEINFKNKLVNKITSLYFYKLISKINDKYK